MDFCLPGGSHRYSLALVILGAKAKEKIMQHAIRRNIWSLVNVMGLLAVGLSVGCRSDNSCCMPTEEKPTAAMAAPAAPAPVAPAAVAPPAAPATPVVAATPAVTPAPIRIKVGATSPFKDTDGNLWLPDQGFADGETTERPEVQIANTKTPALYQSERFSMTSFTQPVPNGKYTVKLHFAETYEGITAPGERVFSFNVEGKAFNDFDVWAKAGGPLRAYVESVPVEITDGKLDISFTAKVENPEINGIEIIPGS
jgi:Malectin domain